jgi:N-acetylglucosaminyl-diphospho-decaprenol L-rhamnosyltransferase
MTQNSAPRVTVIIVNYNAGDRLRRCLDCLAAQIFQDFETILVDNWSTDDSLEHVRAAALPVTIDEAGTNLGFAAANNRAAKTATGEWLAFLNPDAYPEPGWLAALLTAARRHPGVDAFGSTQIDAANPDKLDGAGDAYHFSGVPYRGHHGWSVASLPPEGECFAPCAAAAMYRRSTFAALGGFEESFFCYCEDVDLGFRLRLAGGRAMQIPDALVLHEGSGVTGRRSDFTVYHGHRNRIWAYYRNMPLALLIVTVPFQALANIYLLARFAFLGEAKPYLRAMRDGFAGLPAQTAARREIQRTRKISLGALAKILTWSPVKLFQKRAKIWNS